MKNLVKDFKFWIWMAISLVLFAFLYLLSEGELRILYWVLIITPVFFGLCRVKTLYLTPIFIAVFTLSAAIIMKTVFGLDLVHVFQALTFPLAAVFYFFIIRNIIKKDKDMPSFV